MKQIPRENLEEKFSITYNKLNPRQQLAVDTLEGPIMVIAGPGTGKTQILAARIGRILLDTDAGPENILCLTYTDAGTIAMRRRLQQLIGPEAYKVNIYTFHAFCNDVIQDNLHLFEKTSLDAVSELESVEIFKELIDHFQKDHPLKRYRGDVYYEINNLRSLFSSMKREGWTPEYIGQAIDNYLASLPEREEYIAKRAVKEFKKGDVRTDKIEEEQQKMEKLRAAVNEFGNFQQIMRRRNRYDFDDMINWVIKVFEENEAVLASYQERFQYILVDEYQDTSGTQNRLVQLLINFWDVPNIFVVGDDDQSIFRFQGASVENMIGFANRYTQDLKTVVLTNNYRSTQPILNISKSLIDNNEERLVKQLPGLSKDLLSSKAELADLTHDPVLQEYNSPKEEMAGITKQISALLDEGIAPGKISVIYKENKYGEELANYFRLRQIPFYSKREINVLAQPFARKIVQVLRYLNAEHDTPYGGDEMLFEILHYDFYQLKPMEIARLTVEVNAKRYQGEATSLRRLLYDKAQAVPKDLFDTGLPERLKNFSQAMEALIGDVPNITLQELFERIIQRGGVLQYIMQSDNKVMLMQLLTALFDFIKEETARNPVLQLKGLVNILDLMEKEGLPLPMQKFSGTEHGVNLLTAHGSKGLEYEHVFVAGANSGLWEKKRRPGGGYSMPDTLFESLPDSSRLEELRRLFYVALTRAEKHLTISFSRYRSDGKEQEPSMFIAEIQAAKELPVQQVKFTDEEMMEFEALQFTTMAPQIEQAEADFITNLLDKFVMNVTALNTYLQCPLQFYYRNLIRIPSGKNEATEFGSAVHDALEKLFRRLSDPVYKPDLYDSTVLDKLQDSLVKDFTAYMYRHRENFMQEAYDRRMEYGDTVLRNYFDKYIHQWNTVVAVERNIKGVVVNGVPIKGKLDKLEFTGKEVNVVDYKTGNIDYAREKLKAPNEKDPNGGDYWRQAVFYKILLDNYTVKDWRVISSEFDFVEPDKKGEYQKQKIVITPADVETVKQQLTVVWQKIQARDFYTGCGKDDCHWCNFVKENKLAVALHELEVED